ncbi:MAG: hypothetical protein QOG74_136 [Alphaproteobacteria bacterium]|jgi:hypothetical protein|nr:hypothetical protein [Alphaproteobacteria bacterium]
MVVGLSLLVAACSTTALESQTKMQEARQGRIYFLRGNSLLAIGGFTPEIQINGQKVGNLANNSYFFIDRAPGSYKVSTATTLAFGSYSADVVLLPGGVAYVELAPRAGAIMGSAIGGAAGGLIAASTSNNSGRFSLAVLDAKVGAAMLQQLKQ